MDVICLQETKKESVGSKLCYAVWGGNDCEWRYRSSRGRSGGLLTIWRKDCFTLLNSVEDEGFLSISGVWKVNNSYCHIVNVYAPCATSEKKVLWDNLVRVKNQIGDGAWCVIGDFNAVVDPHERKGKDNSISRREVSDFWDFIYDMELSDIPLTRWQGNE